MSEITTRNTTTAILVTAGLMAVGRIPGVIRNVPPGSTVSLLVLGMSTEQDGGAFVGVYNRGPHGYGHIETDDGHVWTLTAESFTPKDGDGPSYRYLRLRAPGNGPKFVVFAVSVIG